VETITIGDYNFRPYATINDMAWKDYRALSEAYEKFAKIIVNDAEKVLGGGETVSVADAVHSLICATGSENVIGIVSAIYRDENNVLTHAGRCEVINDNATIDQVEKMMQVFFLKFLENLKKKGAKLLVDLTIEEMKKQVLTS